MKNRIITASILFVMLSCTRDDVNLDQHATYEAIPESLVTYAEKELSDYMNRPAGRMDHCDEHPASTPVNVWVDPASFFYKHDLLIGLSVEKLRTTHTCMAS